MGRYIFAVRAVPDPQTLPRLINHFAQRDLTPANVEAQVEGGVMRVLIEQSDLNPETAAIIAAKIRTMVLVESVVLSIQAPALEAALPL